MNIKTKLKLVFVFKKKKKLNNWIIIWWSSSKTRCSNLVHGLLLSKTMRPSDTCSAQYNMLLKAEFITVRKAALFKVKMSVHGGAASWLSVPWLSDGSVLRWMISRLLGGSFRRLSTRRKTEASLYLLRRPKTSCPENSTHPKPHTLHEYYFNHVRLILRHLL